MAFWLPIVMAIAGKALQAGTQNRALKKQDAATAESIRRQGQFRQEQARSLAQRVAELARSSPETERAAAEQGFRNQLARTRQIARARLIEGQGQGSAAFDDIALRGADAQDALASRLATLFASVDAPGRQRQTETVRTADLGLSFDEIARRARAREQIDRLRIAGIRPNPFWQFVGQGLEAGGKAMMGGGGGGFGGFGGG